MIWRSVNLVLLTSTLGAADRPERSDVVEAIRSPAQWDAVFCPILEARRKEEEPCHVNTVVEAPQRGGPPIAVVFFDHEFSREYAGPGQKRGHFELIGADGRLLRPWRNANVLDVSDDLVQLDQNRLALVQVIPFDKGVRLLSVTPVEVDPQPLLAVFIGPPLEDDKSPDRWSWRGKNLANGALHISVAPISELDVQPRASFEWKGGAARFVGPSGSPQQFFARAPPKDVEAQVTQYAEAADRAWLHKRLREEPGSVVQLRIENAAGDGQPGEACLHRPDLGFGPCHSIWKDGSTWFDGAPTGLWILEVRGLDREELQEFLMPVPAEPRTFRVRPTRTRVKVTDEAAHGLKNVALRLMGEQQSLTWVTDERGEASGPLRPGEYDVSAFVDRTRSMPQTEGVLRAWAGAETTLSLQIVRGETLTGKVIDRHGHAVPGAAVSGVPEARTSDGSGWSNARAGPDGSFVLEGLTRGALTVEARSEDGMSLSRVLPAQAPETAPVTLVLLPRPRLRGRLVSPSGRPITKFVLGESPRERRVSDPEGRFELLLMDGDPELIRFEADGFAVKWLTVQADLGSVRDLGTVLLELAAVIRGVVTDASTGRPLEGVHVTEHVVLPERRTGLCGTGYKPPPEGTSWAESRRDGRFQLTSLSTATVLELSKDGYDTKTVEASRLAAPVALERATGPVLKLEGRVIDEEGRPSFACVSYRADFGRGKVFAGADGLFTIEPSFAAPVRLAACPSPEGPRFPETVVRVQAGTERVTLKVRP